MGASVIPVIIFTAIWGVVGILLPFIVPKGPNRGIVQLVLILTGACCWLLGFHDHLAYLVHFPIILDASWLCCYMAQMNPLIGPRIDNKTLLLMAREWGNRVVT